MNLNLLMGRTKLLAQKHAPEGLLVLGLGAMVGAVVLAAKAGQEHKKVHNQNVDDILTAEVLMEEHPDVPETKNEVVLSRVRSAGRWIKLYGPAAGAFVGGTIAIVGSHGMMESRVRGLSAAYALLLEGFYNYRQRVREQDGLEADQRYLTGIHKEEIEGLTIDEDGNAAYEKLMLEVEDELSPYVIFFDDKSTVEYQVGNHKANTLYLTLKQQYWTDRLHRDGHVFLNQILVDMQIKPVPIGQFVGWVSAPGDPNMDDFIDFGLDLPHNQEAKAGLVEGWMLDLNIQGPIYRLI